jgi:hypothetical protein
MKELPHMKPRVTVVLLITVLLVGALSPADARGVDAATQRSHVAAVHTQSHAAAFDKTRFLAHLAVAAFLVHYVYKKYKAGKLGRTHLITDVKAAAAALLAYHEMKTAYGIAKSSNSKTLRAVIAPISALTGTLSAMSSKLKHGDTSQISTANSQESSLQSTAGKNGYSYKDQQPSGFAGF